MPTQQLRLEYVDPNQLRNNPANWRQHPENQVAVLQDQINEVSWAGAALVNERNTADGWSSQDAVPTLIDGHLRKKVATTRGEKVPVLFGRWTPKQEALLLATLDPIAGMAAQDDLALKALMGNIQTESENINAMLKDLLGEKELVDTAAVGAAPEANLDAADELQVKWGTAVGQVWKIESKTRPGEFHYVGCGSCTDEAFVLSIFGDRRAKCMWTDPPYGVNYVGRGESAMPVTNDAPEQLEALLTDAFKIADKVLVDSSPYYVCHADKNGPIVRRVIEDVIGWKFHETLIWLKDHMVLTRCDYHYQHEPILYGWKAQNRFWYSGRNKTTIIAAPRPQTSDRHPTEKPVLLVAETLVNSTQPGDLVYEPFGGSGTTIVACETLARLGICTELEPKFAAVIIERLHEATGKAPEKIR